MPTTPTKLSMFSEQLHGVPNLPGIYIMKDRNEGVLYVGKAVILRNRLRQYFSSTEKLEPKIREMAAKIHDFEYIVTESESEALLLEYNLIKKHQPRYNARLKDDKSYPFIKIDTNEDFPQVYITRQVQDDGANYFGPFASASSVRKTLHLLKKLFPYRSCTKQITQTDSHPCLDYHIKRCVGPCIGAATKTEYSEIIQQVIMFLDGKTESVKRLLTTQMKSASDSLQFERAVIFRDQISALAKLQEKQKVLHLSNDNMDVIGFAPSKTQTWMEIFFIRKGKLIERDYRIMSQTEGNTTSEILTAFVKQFYQTNPHTPSLILIPEQLDDKNIIEQWLTTKRGGSVKIKVPLRGEKRGLINMVTENALQRLSQHQIKEARDTTYDIALKQLQEALELPEIPKRIECYDISNLHGSNPVGSMVVFRDGKPERSSYRRFSIKTVEQINDYAMMREILLRRFNRMVRRESQDGSPSKQNIDNTKQLLEVPDLVLIDGGRGHLGAALQVFLETGLDHISLASLAKENELLFVPQIKEPIFLPRSSQGLFMVQRIRDEAHRFAITFHRQRRSKKAIRSSLDNIHGIGPERRSMLLRRFGSVKKLRNAPLDEITSLPGITKSLATQIKDGL